MKKIYPLPYLEGKIIRQVVVGINLKTGEDIVDTYREADRTAPIVDKINEIIARLNKGE